MKFMIALAALLISQIAISKSGTELVYSMVKFTIPSDYTLIADVGGSDNILIFRYGDEKGKRYIAFTDMTNDVSVDYGCKVDVFFNVLFSKDKNNSCNIDNLNVLDDVFIKNKKVQTWSTGKYQINYSSDGGSSFVFLGNRNGKLIKIDTDFLSEGEFRSIFRGLQ